MSKFSKFMKANKKVKANEMHPVTKSLCDEQGNPLDWEFKHKVKEYAEQGYTFAVVLDLSKYFDTLNHEILINLLRKNVKDERVVQLIKRYLKSGVMENGEIRIRPTIPDEWSCYRLEKIKCQEKELSIIYDKTGEKYHREKGFQVWCNGECIHKSLYPEEIKVAR